MEFLPILIPGTIALAAMLVAWQIKPKSRNRSKERQIIIADRVIIYSKQTVIHPKS